MKCRRRRKVNPLHDVQFYESQCDVPFFTIDGNTTVIYSLLTGHAIPVNARTISESRKISLTEALELAREGRLAKGKYTETAVKTWVNRIRKDEKQKQSRRLESV